MMITMVADYVQSLGWTIVYGDSVASWTPVVLRVRGQIVVTSVDKVVTYVPATWQRDLLGDKETLELEGVEIWSDAGWTAAPLLIRHALADGKRMLRVTTGSGVIDVTDDHSLLTLDGHEIAPCVLKPGDRILHSQLPSLESSGAARSEYVVKRVAQSLKDGAGFPSWILGQSEDLRRAFLDNLPGEFESQELRAGITLIRESLTPTPIEDEVVSIDEIPYEGFVYDFTTGNHHFAAGVGKIVAHNTDSVYLRPPDHYYEEIDAAYRDGKITKMEHWTKMVEISLDICQGFGKEINDMISSYTGNTYLRMEDEGVKFPMLMTGKKKYAGIAHKPGGIDFFPKKLFVRGIDFIKTGQMRLAITLGNKILRQALHIDNDREVLEIVEEIFKDAVTNTAQWSTDDFVETKTYKPKKKNVCVLRFAERMRERDERMRAENVRRAKRGEPPLPRPFEPPAPGQKFKCLVVKPKSVYSLDGKKLKLSIGDLMEYAEVVKDQSNGFEVDVPHYMAGKVATACARFINYHELFTPPEGLDERKADEFSINAAKAYVKKIVDRYVEKPIHHQICKRAYKRVTQAVADELGDSAQMLAVLGATGGEVDSVADVMDAGLSEFAAYLVRVARGQISESRAKREARAIIKEATGGDTRAQLKMLRAMNKIRSGYVELLREEILECAPLMRKMLSTYTDCLERMVVSMRTAMASGSDATMDRCAVRMGMDSESLAKADEFWIKLRSAVYLDVREEMLLDELAKVRRSISGASV
jgi:hypothetical protein